MHNQKDASDYMSHRCLLISDHVELVCAAHGTAFVVSRIRMVVSVVVLVKAPMFSLFSMVFPNHYTTIM